MQGYIHDGYTVDGYIAEVKRLHPHLRFTFRPMLIQERAVIIREIQKMDNPVKEETTAAQAISKRVTVWDLKDGGGKVVELTTSKILRAHPALFSRLFQIVLGTVESDEDPEIAEADRNEQADRDLKAALAGDLPSEADVKN